MNILVVDDELIQVETISRGLRSKGYHVIPSLSAEEALKKIRRQDPQIDMVITDYSMPGMNGICLLKKIRETHHTLPVIMMTAYGDKKLVIDALRNRCDSFIEKPFTLDQLMRETERAKINILQNTSTHRLSELIPRHIHQINNPLMSIMGSAELTINQVDNPDAVKRCIKRIIGCAEKICEINRKLIRLEEKKEIEIQPVNIQVLLEECLAMFKDLLILKNISVDKKIASHDMNVQGNNFALEQLFKNLILNAIDAMDGRNEKQLSVSAANDPSSKTVVIKIKDTGCGIAERSLGSLFTPYYTSKKNGTGLGLAVAKGIVEKHNGQITVESKPGNGACFTVTLPMNLPT
ncbi:MAG: response regulator [Deltaproteobacteria bacterium]|nr:response regulator [Deltaproteobacteria bacterium]MBW2152170.1 response regulator [Deltaproteobacteria bacterium]